MKYVFIRLIRFYRRFISPMKPPCCRFTPTCSAYALEAFQKRGFFVGLLLTIWRILRCNPFCMPGYDPVPEKGFDRYPVRIPKYTNGAEPNGRKKRRSDRDSATKAPNSDGDKNG